VLVMGLCTKGTRPASELGNGERYVGGVAELDPSPFSVKASEVPGFILGC
jgi:hypothetical protein